MKIHCFGELGNTTNNHGLESGMMAIGIESKSTKTKLETTKHKNSRNINDSSTQTIFLRQKSHDPTADQLRLSLPRGQRETQCPVVVFRCCFNHRK